MSRIIESPDSKWTFEHFSNVKDVVITTPSILITVEPDTEADSEFPFKLTYGYYLDNPYSELNDEPTFRLFDKEEIFILKKAYTDNLRVNLLQDLKELKKDFDIKVYGKTKELFTDI